MEASRRDGRDLDLLGARDEIHIPSVRADAHVGLRTGVVLRARPPEDHGGGGGGVNLQTRVAGRHLIYILIV